MSGREVLTAVYDLSRSPATYDFVHFLVNAERQRLREGYQALRIRLLPGERQYSERDFAFSKERKEWRLHNLLVPLCRMLPSCTGYEVGGEGEQTLSYSPFPPFSDTYFRASAAARSAVEAWLGTKQPIVTITIRQSDFQPERNSDLAQWLLAAQWLSGQGLIPIFIPDTEALIVGHRLAAAPWRSCEPAAYYPDIRLALYQRAALNLFTSGGPYGLAWWGGAPFFMCRLIVPSINACTEANLTSLGLTPDAVLNPRQKISWKNDVFEEIRDDIAELLDTPAEPAGPAPSAAATGPSGTVLMSSKPLSIVHTESSLGWGGQEIRILSEAQGFIARGHQVRLICPPQARILSEAPAWGVPTIALPIEKKRVVGLKALLEWFKHYRVDVISTHSSTDAWLVALAMLVLGRPHPVVRTRHISAAVPRNVLSRWLYTRGTARIVTAGEKLKRELIERNGFPEARIDSVPTGIDAQRFRPGDKAAAREALRLRAGAKLVGIVATLRSWKGHGDLIEALAGMPADIFLVIVGDGPMRSSLEALVESRGISERVRFVGNQADVLPWLHALDVFALPSYANEGVPQALVQAMLTALPSVTTTTGGIGEAAIDGETALVVPARDPAALRGALQRVLDDPELARRLGEAARAHCSARFSYETMLERMEVIYRQVSGRR